MSVHDSGWPTSLIFCENDRYLTISSCYLFDIYVVYVLCKVHPNTRDEDKDQTCKDVPVTAPKLTLLISNRHIQAACIVLKSPSCLTNPSQACFVNYVLLLHKFVMEQLCRLCAHLDFVDHLWTMWTLLMACELCELCALCELSSCTNYVDYVHFVNYVGHLSTCHPCWASMNCYTCLNCVLRSVEEMEKICFQACHAS
jgi:hypothetical protein